MDREKLLRLEIEATEPDAIEDALEEKQNDLETRMDTAESNGNMERKKQLEVELAEVKELLKQVKEEKKKAAEKPKEQPAKKEEKARGAVPTAVEEKERRAVPTAIDEKQQFADNMADKLSDKLTAMTGVIGKMREKSEESKEKSKEKAKEKAEEAQEKRHEAELKEKAAMLRKKATEEEAVKAKAEKEAAKAEEKKAEKAEKDGSDADSAAELPEYEKLLNEGIADYATKKYKDAFQKIFKVANAERKSKLSDEKLGQAEQLLGRMYKNGEGTTADESRAWFWFEKAAEHENVEGCLAMGQRNAELTPKSPEEEETFRENALKYFKIAGNNGSKVAKEKFVDICIKKKGQISFGDNITASKFLDDLIALEDDSFLKQRLADKKKELNAKPSKDRPKRNSRKFYAGSRDAWAIIGALLTAFGVMCFCNAQLQDVDVFFNFSNIIPEYFINNMPPIGSLAEALFREFEILYTYYADATPYWAALFIPAGFFLSSISYVEKRGTLANLCCEASLYFSVISCVMVVYCCVKLWGVSVEEIFGLVLFFVITAVIPQIFGAIIRFFIGD